LDLVNWRIGVAHSNGSAKVVSIQSFRLAECFVPSRISQERLRDGIRLLEEQRRILDALQEFKLSVDRELASGAEIEPGDLTFDRDLKVVRQRKSTHPRLLQISVR
jgi:hypothetical protein